MNETTDNGLVAIYSIALIEVVKILEDWKQYCSRSADFVQIMYLYNVSRK